MVEISFCNKNGDIRKNNGDICKTKGDSLAQERLISIHSVRS